MNLPATNFSPIAPLPVVYESAKNALAQCEQIDECREWADKAAALASYARQANDDALMNHARRIQVRAVTRMGELIERIEPQHGARTDRQPAVGDHSRLYRPDHAQLPLTRSEAARNAGLSEHQQVQAVRVARAASADPAEFERQVESDTPPTITALAEQGKRTAHVSYNSGENEWYTPPQFIDAACEVMGSIDLDPASSEIANKTVKASRYFTKEQDGLSQKWYGNVWLNPPYAQPLISQFADKVVASLGDVQQAIVLVNNATETAWFQTMAAECQAICFPRARIRFLDPQGRPGAPLQGQAILYFGGESFEFCDRFSQFGVAFLH